MYARGLALAALDFTRMGNGTVCVALREGCGRQNREQQSYVDGESKQTAVGAKQGRVHHDRRTKIVRSHAQTYDLGQAVVSVKCI